jgi:predicted metal-binding membrane protein
MTSAARNEVTGAGALQALARPRAIAIACIGVLVAAGWVYLALMLAGGDGLLAAICAPTFGASAATTALQAVLVFAMWGAMALAMMLPTAGPMILTYADLAETAARRGEAAASPLVLTAGYVGVWLAVAVVAAALQILLARLSLIDPAMAAASPLFSGAAFIAAGAYQFSALKHACITQCQRPFTYFFANWTADARGVFRQGVTQGLYCLGCCWAMMALMLVVGTMNVLWMAGLGAIMTIEKVGTTTRFSRIIGAVFIVAGAVLIVTAVIAKWPRVG